ncbi:tRNA lysidine(34) synthetase TilS [Paenibacillus albicereus]|uniref:tRNA(Ile)-lysidine synthase n=1 Tax=Paenibacillus albicereus TaxID=2726185 RepID=A0A6H2GS35_9BACL|nr:tRNA lysidine(34) synthetase TilS [Paenibacillus albicereus]QJC50224.1 tRNA lysidine(34) synthetase TilS [Paenibacillus albicereus]
MASTEPGRQDPGQASPPHASGDPERVRRELLRMGADERLWEPGDTVLVAVSGGPDSMALLHAVHMLSPQLGVRVAAAHADHGFRPEASAREAGTVRRYCAGLGIPCETAELDVPAHLAEHGGNKQAEARRLRYRFLLEAAGRAGASRIALAHHADDQAETVLMRLLRGSSPAGLAGIPLRRMEGNTELIRPLLRIHKPDLLAYCERHAVPYEEDGSNSSTDYTRNAIRLEALPYLEAFNGRLAESLCRTAESAAAESDYLDARTREVFASGVLSEEGRLTMSGAAFAALHVALQRRLIKLILDYLALETASAGFDEVERIRLGALSGTPSSWRVDLSRGLRFRREYGRLVWTRREDEEPQPYAIEVPEPEGVWTVAEAGVEIRFSAHRHTRDGTALFAASDADARTAFFDWDKLELPLLLRPRRDGDRMRPLGLNGTKKVQDMFVDGKLPPSQRPSFPLLCDGGGRILWIPGLRRSSHALADEGTRLLLRAEARQAGGPDRPAGE